MTSFPVLENNPGNFPSSDKLFNQRANGIFYDRLAALPLSSLPVRPLPLTDLIINSHALGHSR